MAYRQPSTPLVPKTAHNQDWNTPRRPRTPRGEYSHLRRYMIIPTQPGSPSAPNAAVAQ
jgi:hypothetical protein